MPEAKTKPTQTSVDDFIAAIEKPTRRADAGALREMMERITGEAPTMWGPTIIGFGSYHYRYASGHEGDMCRVGFSPRSANLVLYVGKYPGFEQSLAGLGKFKLSTSCVYLNKLADVDLGVLEEIVRRSFEAASDVDQRVVG